MNKYLMDGLILLGILLVITIICFWVDIKYGDGKDLR